MILAQPIVPQSLADALDVIGYTLLILAITGVYLQLYLLPASAAYIMNHPHKRRVLTLNILFGWTGYGWIAAAIWAFIPWPAKENGK
jgi:hypothetical protein